MFWACSFHVLNLQFNEQYFVILWVSWCKNRCFWKRFTCKCANIFIRVREFVCEWANCYWVCKFAHLHTCGCIKTCDHKHKFAKRKFEESLDQLDNEKFKIFGWYLKISVILQCSVELRWLACHMRKKKKSLQNLSLLIFVYLVSDQLFPTES